MVVTSPADRPCVAHPAKRLRRPVTATTSTQPTWVRRAAGVELWLLMARPYTLYQSDPAQLLARIDTHGPGERLDPAWFSVHLTTLLPIEYRARATWANTHGGTLEHAATALRELLAEALRRGHLFTHDGFHELTTGDHVLVLAPERDCLIEYLHLDRSKARRHTPTGRHQGRGAPVSDPTGHAADPASLTDHAPNPEPEPATHANANEAHDLALAWDGTTSLPEPPGPGEEPAVTASRSVVSGSPTALARLQEATAGRPYRAPHTRRTPTTLRRPATPEAATALTSERAHEPVRRRSTEEVTALLQTSFVNHIAFSSSVLTWAGSVPGQSHTKMAAEIRRSILSAALSQNIRAGRDGTHETSDDIWHTVLDPTGSRALFARRQHPLLVECDDPDAVDSADLADYLDSARVDGLVITRNILTNAGPAEGQSLDDLRDELLDAVETALEDGHVTPGFLGRHQLYGDGWLMVLSPAGTHMVTARRSQP